MVRFGGNVAVDGASISVGRGEVLGPIGTNGAGKSTLLNAMPFIRSISDRLTCLEAGRVIADGEPDAVCADPRVVVSYLGTDDRAVARSGTVT